MHFVHVFCEDLGKFKATQSTAADTIEENEEKHKSEIELWDEAADLVVVVGSRLQRKYSECLPHVEVEIITPGILQTFFNESTQLVKNKEIKKFSVFMFGRESKVSRSGNAWKRCQWNHFPCLYACFSILCICLKFNKEKNKQTNKQIKVSCTTWFHDETDQETRTGTENLYTDQSTRTKIIKKKHAETRVQYFVSRIDSEKLTGWKNVEVMWQNVSVHDRNRIGKQHFHSNLNCFNK